MKTALVLGGGGSRGSYQIGVWQALRELGIRVDIVTGSSVGALNGAMVVQGNFETAVAVWKELDISAVFDLEGKATLAAYAKEFFKQGGLSANGLAQLLNQYLDEAAIRLSPIDFGLVTVKKKGLVPCPIYLEDIPDRQLIDYLLASAACYPVVKSHPILEDEYIDGGYYDNLPIDLAKEKGAEAIIAVNLDAVGMLQSSLKELKRDPNTVYISPSWDLGNFLMFEKETAKRNIRLGYLDALKAFGFFDGTAYTFQKQDFSRFAKQKSVTVRTWKELFQEARRSGNLIRSVGCNALKNYLSSQTKKPLIPSVILETAAQTAGRILEVDPLLLYTVDRFHEALSQKAQLLSQEKELAALLQSSTQKSISPKAKWLKTLDTKGITLCLAALFQAKAELWFPFAPIFPKETVAALYLAAFGISPS